MRFTSLFRLPRNQQFEYKPRYYDPVKEFVEERRRLAGNGEQKEGESEMYVSRVRFERKSTNTGLSGSLLQLVIALALSGVLLGWLYLGNDILYVMLLLVPLYLFFRLRKK